MAETKVQSNNLKSFKHRLCFAGTASSGWVGYITAEALPWNTLRPFDFIVTFRAPTGPNIPTSNCYIMGSRGNAYSDGIVIQLGNGDNGYAQYGAIGLNVQLSSNGSSWDLTPDSWNAGHIIKPCVWHQVRVQFDLTKYTVSHKEETATTWTVFQEATSSSKLASSSGVNLGTDNSSSSQTLWKYALIDICGIKAISGDTVLYDGEELYSKYVGLGDDPRILEWYE